MKLYGYFRSSATYRVRIALNLKGIPWERVVIDLRAPVSAQHTREFRTLNPQGLVPVLVDGEHTLTQSFAMLEYLEETHPQPPLLPRAPAARAEVRALALAIACDIHPLDNLRVLNYLPGMPTGSRSVSTRSSSKRAAWATAGTCTATR